MDIKPVITAEEPQYPKKEGVLPAELQSKLPGRWLRSSAVKVAMGTLAVVVLAGCKPLISGVPAPTELPNEDIAEGGATEEVLAGVPALVPINAAPFFEHGEGFGVVSEIEHACTDFITEDEVLGLINEIAAKYGFSFTADGCSVGMMQPDVIGVIDNPEYITISLDFIDNANGAVIEYVSAQDVLEWSGAGNTKETKPVDVKFAAKALYDSLGSADNYSDSEIFAGVLYDPCAGDKETSITELKEQIEEYFDWLRGRGMQ